MFRLGFGTREWTLSIAAAALVALGIVLAEYGGWSSVENRRATTKIVSIACNPGAWPAMKPVASSPVAARGLRDGASRTAATAITISCRTRSSTSQAPIRARTNARRSIANISAISRPAARSDFGRARHPAEREAPRRYRNRASAGRPATGAGPGQRAVARSAPCSRAAREGAALRRRRAVLHALKALDRRGRMLSPRRRKRRFAARVA